MVALSIMETEYIVATEAIQEVVWLRNLLRSLKVVPHVSDPIKLPSDNMLAISYSKDFKFHRKTK